MNNKYFVPHNIALEMKLLGFNEPCLSYYEKESFYLALIKRNDCITPSPLYQQAFRWFREKYELAHNIHPITYNCYVVNQKDIKIYDIGDFDTYEDSELACLIKIIEIVKQQSNESI